MSKVNKYKNTHDIPIVVKNYLRDLMIDNKIERAVISFSGSGDDGCVQDADLYPENIKDVGLDFVIIPKEVWEVMDGIGRGISYNTWNRVDVPREQTTFELRDVFSRILDYWIYDVPVDWVNGEGGEGYCELTIKNKKLSVKIASHEWIQEPGPTFVCKL